MKLSFLLNDAAPSAVRKSCVALDPDISLIRCADALAKLPNYLPPRARTAVVA